MGIFISVNKIIECALCAVVFAALMSACCFRLAGILQSCGYSGKKLAAWVGKKNNMTLTRHVLLAMLCVLACAVISLCFSFAEEWAPVVGLAAYLIFLPLYIWADNRVALRSPVARTPRFVRLYVVLSLLFVVFAYVAATLLNYADHVWGNRIFGLLKYCVLSVFPLLMFPVLLLANAVSKIYEIPRNKRYIKAAKKKLGESHITVIGITGSYGKTSAKRILTEILSKKYRVLSTPRSHNTPIGIALTVNNSDLDSYDIFIAEMGARHLGDIAELCEMCPPDYSLITGICPQHLESFGSVENIIKAKGEILNYTKKEAVIARDCFDLFAGYPCAKTRAEEIENIECGCGGSTFTLEADGEEAVFTTKLLGRHAAENIALAACIAKKAGMSLKEIAAAVKDMDYIEHRLQLIKSGGVNILDDGYNSNIKGAAAAVEVLRSFPARKIAVTPGLVELGVLEESENKKLGEELVGLDLVILVGDTLVAPVKEGYLENGGDGAKLKLAPTLAKAQEELKNYLRNGDTVLFLNDLPDIYT